MSERSLASGADSALGALSCPLPAGSVGPDAMGPAGQLVLLGDAQRGLDGRYYAPAVPPSAADGPSDEVASPYLGPYTDFRVPAVQLDLWDRQEQASRYLRCRCPGGDFLVGAEGQRLKNPVHEDAVRRGVCLNRCAKCGIVPIEEGDIPLFRSERGAFRFAKTVQCGHWTCPSCGARYAREVASALDCAIAAWLRNNDGYRLDEAPYDVWLFTPTTPHRATDSMETTIARLYDAWERFAASHAWREWSKKVGLRARTRAFDVVFGGKNGTHPHFHIALFVDGVPGFRHASALSRVLGGTRGHGFEVPPELIAAWLRAVRAAGVDVPNEDAFREHALDLQGGDEAAAYFVKWGLSSETGATTLKKGGPLALLDAAGAGERGAGELYREFCIAVNGRQVVTGLKDTLRIVGVSADDIEAHRAARQAHLDAEHPPTLVAPLALVVRRCLWKTALAVGRGVVVAEVTRADLAGENPQTALDAFLFAVARDAKGPRMLLESSA